MSISELSDKLKNLQDELTQLLAAEHQTRQQIDDVLSQINDQLSQQSADKNDSESLQIKNINERLRRFQTEHPELTESVNRVLVTLGNMGI